MMGNNLCFNEIYSYHCYPFLSGALFNMFPFDFNILLLSFWGNEVTFSLRKYIYNFFKLSQQSREVISLFLKQAGPHSAIGRAPDW